MTEFQKQQLWDLWEELQDQEESMEAHYIFQYTSTIRQKIREVRNEIETVVQVNEISHERRSREYEGVY